MLLPSAGHQLKEYPLKIYLGSGSKTQIDETIEALKANLAVSYKSRMHWPELKKHTVRLTYLPLWPVIHLTSPPSTPKPLKAVYRPALRLITLDRWNILCLPCQDVGWRSLAVQGDQRWTLSPKHLLANHPSTFQVFLIINQVCAALAPKTTWPLEVNIVWLRWKMLMFLQYITCHVV